MQTESARCPIRDDGSVKQVNQVPKPGGNSIALLLSQLFPNECRGGQNGPGSGITRSLRQRRTFGRRFLKVRGSIYSHLRPQALSRDLFEAGLCGGFNCYQPGQHIFASGVSLLPHQKVDATPVLAQVTGNRYGAIARKARSLTKLKARSLSRPGPPWMDQVQRPDSSSELLYCDHYPGRTTLYWCTAGQSARTARKVELSIRTCQINDRDTL